MFTPHLNEEHFGNVYALERYSLEALSLAPLCQTNCSLYRIKGPNSLLPIFFKGGWVSGDFEEAVEVEFLQLMQIGLTALLLDDEDNVRRVRYNMAWELEIDGVVHTRDEELWEPDVLGTRRLVRWE